MVDMEWRHDDLIVFAGPLNSGLPSTSPIDEI